MTLAGYGADRTPARARVEYYSAGDRMKRSFRGLGTCWGVAVLGAFIPVAHFLLVPGFGLAGLVVAWRRGRAPDRLVSLDGACPDCGTEQSFDVGGRWAPPVSVSCAGCGRTLTAATDIAAPDASVGRDREER